MPKLNDADKRLLKEKHSGRLLVVSLPAENGKSAEDFVFKQPEMKTIASATIFEQSDPIRSSQIVFNDCLVFGDPQAATDPERFLAIVPRLSGLIKVRTAEAGEL